MCTPSIPAGLKRPPPSKTNLPYHLVCAHINTLSGEDPEEAYGNVFGLQAKDSVRQCSFYIGWRNRRSKAEELRLPPRSEEFEDFGVPSMSEASPLKEELD